jgi:hypothetical protein
MYVFLDDERNPWSPKIEIGFPQIPHSHWYVVRDIDEFKSVIDHYLSGITHIAFDHDLAEEHYPWNGNKHDDGRTGLDCAKYLVQKCIDTKTKLPNFSVHSMNPAGRENILSYLESYRRFSEQN